MRGDGQVINPADNGTNSARWTRTTDRQERRREKRGIEENGSTACRSPSLLAGLLEETGGLVTMAGMWMRNRPHGLTRVSAKSAAKGKLEAEQWIWPDPCLDPNLFVLQSNTTRKILILSSARVRMFSCDGAFMNR